MEPGALRPAPGVNCSNRNAVLGLDGLKNLDGLDNLVRLGCPGSPGWRANRAKVRQAGAWISRRRRGLFNSLQSPISIKPRLHRITLLFVAEGADRANTGPGVPAEAPGMQFWIGD